jgi:hypothetical protein
VSAARHLIVTTDRAGPVTLAQMGRTAREAGSTYSIREWAAKLATKAKPRDYVGQLEQIYAGILDRWRYVQEPEEWIHGSADSLIGHVLGTKYATPAGTDATRLKIHELPNRQKGWGDCDDVACLTAAGVVAIGMSPTFRVARSRTGAHVSVVARTPKGDLISLDPVGHPDHPFGWAMPADTIELWDLHGRRIDTPAEKTGSMLGAASTCLACQPSDGSMGSLDHETTAFGAIDFGSGEAANTGSTRGHYVITPAGDLRGARVIAVAQHTLELFRRGIATDGATGVDEHGNVLRYDSARDLWIDARLEHTPLGQTDDAMGGFRSFFRRIKRGAKRLWKRARRIVQRVGKVVRGVLARVMASKMVQRLVAGALQIYGVPMRLTRGVLAAGSELIKRGGIIGFIKLLRHDKKAAMRLVAQAAASGLRAAARFAGPDEDLDELTVLEQDGGQTVAQPVAALAGVPGLYEFGALDITPAPAPGHYYRITKGDTLSAVAARAYGTKSDRKANYERMKWINAVAANQYAFDPRAKDNLFPRGRISFDPQFDCDPSRAFSGSKGRCYATIWIPLTAGDEPPAAAPPAPRDAAPTPRPTPPPPEPPVVAPPPVPAPRPSTSTEPITPPPPVRPSAPATPIDRFGEACRRTGGQVVQTSTGPGCVHCQPNERWDGRRCATTAPPSCPPGSRYLPYASGQGGECVPVPPPADTAARAACLESGNLWNATRRQCLPRPATPPPPRTTAPPSCPPGSRYLPYASGQGGECVPVPPPADTAARAACLESGNLWNATRRQCLPRPATPPPVRPAASGVNPLWILALLGVS